MQPVPSRLGPDAEQFRVLLRQHLPDLRQRFGVATLSLFGSYVRGEQRPQSDLDVLGEFAETPGLFAYVELRATLSALLGIRVDLVMRSALKPHIARHVLPEVGRYEKDGHSNGAAR